MDGKFEIAAPGQSGVSNVSELEWGRKQDQKKQNLRKLFAPSSFFPIKLLLLEWPPIEAVAKFCAEGAFALDSLP